MRIKPVAKEIDHSTVYIHSDRASSDQIGFQKEQKIKRILRVTKDGATIGIGPMHEHGLGSWLPRQSYNPFRRSDKRSQRQRTKNSSNTDDTCI